EPGLGRGQVAARDEDGVVLRSIAAGVTPATGYDGHARERGHPKRLVRGTVHAPIRAGPFADEAGEGRAGEVRLDARHHLDFARGVLARAAGVVAGVLGDRYLRHRGGHEPPRPVLDLDLRGADVPIVLADAHHSVREPAQVHLGGVRVLSRRDVGELRVAVAAHQRDHAAVATR